MRLIFLWTHFISWYTSTLAIATRPPPNENDTCTPAPMKMAEDQTTYGCGTKRPPPKHRHLFWLISWIPQFANNQDLQIADTTKSFSWGRAIVCYSWLFQDLLICRFSAGSRTRSAAVHSSHNTTEEKVPRLCYCFALFAANNKSLDLNKDGFCIFRL
jgi:hypothetical protein